MLHWTGMLQDQVRCWVVLGPSGVRVSRSAGQERTVVSHTWRPATGHGGPSTLHSWLSFIAFFFYVFAESLSVHAFVQSQGLLS